MKPTIEFPGPPGGRDSRYRLTCSADLDVSVTEGAWTGGEPLRVCQHIGGSLW